jgi:hydrogenase maturation factor
MNEGFLVGKNGEYAAIPYGKQYIIIHKGSQMEKVCRTEGSARKYIDALKKGKSVGKLPL